MNENMIDHAKKQFATHKATLIQDTERYTIIDWRRADGDGHYYINFIVDKFRGSLIVSGDLGDSIATWHNPIKISKLASWIYHDVGYYFGKIQCSSNYYNFDSQEIYLTICQDLGFDDEEYAYFIDQIVEIAYDKCLIYDNTADALKEKIKSEISDSIRGSITGYDFIPTDDLYEIVTINNPDGFEYLSDSHVGDIHDRVYLWAYGFHMACEQLGLL